MTHECDEYCHVKSRGVGALTPAVVGAAVAPHLAARPDSYPSSAALVDVAAWPDQPPYCVECGHEILTEADYDPASGWVESHAQLDLEVKYADQ